MCDGVQEPGRLSDHHPWRRASLWPGGGDLDIPVAAVPEPGAWALMIMGFGAMGATLRRRKSAVAV